MDFFQIFAIKAVVSKGLFKLVATISSFSIAMIFALATFFTVRTVAYAVTNNPQKDEDGATYYDRRQDDRMNSIDKRFDITDADRKDKRADSLEHRKIYDAKTDENHDRIIRDEAYFTGAMFLIGLLQLYMKLTNNKQQNNSYQQQREFEFRDGKKNRKSREDEDE